MPTAPTPLTNSIPRRTAPSPRRQPWKGKRWDESVLDEAGRFASGEVYGTDEKLRFKTLYKYDDAGKLTQETQLGPGDGPRNNIVYAYDKIGRQTGYSVYDAAVKLIRQTPGAAPRASAPPNKRK